MELVEEVLLRCPPEDPARLVRAALVCKPWCRLICSRSFRRRFREHHRRLPILGFYANLADGAGMVRFIPTSSFRPIHDDIRHGRVLLNRMPWGAVPPVPDLYVWDPITDEQVELPPFPWRPNMQYWNAAVLCAGVGTCDHLDCHTAGPFVVVFLGMDSNETFAHVYSSELGAWGEATSARHLYDNPDVAKPAVLVGNALYFMLHRGHTAMKFDLATRVISNIRLPGEPWHERSIVLMTTEDGGLGCAVMELEPKLHLYSMEAGPETSIMVLSRVIDLKTSLPALAISISCGVFASVDSGFLLLGTGDGIYCIDLKNDSVFKVCNMLRDPCYGVLPYMGFYTPCAGSVAKGDLNFTSIEEPKLLPPSSTEHDDSDDPGVGMNSSSPSVEGQRQSNDPTNLDDEYSIKNCIAVLESIMELSDVEKAKAASIFKWDQNREIFLASRTTQFVYFGLRVKLLHRHSLDQLRALRSIWHNIKGAFACYM